MNENVEEAGLSPRISPKQSQDLLKILRQENPEATDVDLKTTT